MLKSKRYRQLEVAYRALKKADGPCYCIERIAYEMRKELESRKRYVFALRGKLYRRKLKINE